MDDKYLKILTELEVRGIDVETDLTETINNIASEIKESQPSEFTLEEVRERFLNVLAVNQHAGWGVAKGRIMLRLTFKGLQFLNEYRLTISNTFLNDTIRTNTAKQIELDSTIATNSGIQSTASGKQTVIFRWTAAFACGAMVITGISLMRDIHKDNLSQQVREKDSLIQQLQKKLYHLKSDSSRLSEAKKNSSKKT